LYLYCDGLGSTKVGSVYAGGGGSICREDALGGDLEDGFGGDLEDGFCGDLEDALGGDFGLADDLPSLIFVRSDKGFFFRGLFLSNCGVFGNKKSVEKDA
jgi:hypothetical protein